MSSHDGESRPRFLSRTYGREHRRDWQIIAAQFLPYARALPDRILGHLRRSKAIAADSPSIG